MTGKTAQQYRSIFLARSVCWLLSRMFGGNNSLEGQSQVAKETGVPVQHINEIVQCKRAITLEIALGLERYFGSSAQEWRDNLQTLNYLEWHEAALKMILADLKNAPRQLKWCRTLVKMQLRALLRSGG